MEDKKVNHNNDVGRNFWFILRTDRLLQRLQMKHLRCELAERNFRSGAFNNTGKPDLCTERPLQRL